METKKSCYDCAYRGEVAGSAHTRCKFNWGKSDKSPPIASKQGIINGWYNFPLNYDPVWQEEECKAFSTKIDTKMIKEKYDPMVELLSILK